jgi:DNA invertase Pin-like site-specific DNA recombinase
VPSAAPLAADLPLGVQRDLSQTLVYARPHTGSPASDVPAGCGPPKPITKTTPKNTVPNTSCVRVNGVGDKIGYARVSSADQDPRLQLDALAAEGCLKTYTDTITGTKADRPQWNACLADLHRGDTLIIWKIDRLGRNLRDLIDIVTTLDHRGVAVRSLTNGIIDTTTPHGKLVFGIFALMAEYEAALIRERTAAGLTAARARGRHGGRKPKMTPALINKAQRMYDSQRFTMAEIAQSCSVTPMTIYRNIHTQQQPPTTSNPTGK